MSHTTREREREGERAQPYTGCNSPFNMRMGTPAWTQFRWWSFWFNALYSLASAAACCFQDRRGHRRRSSSSSCVCSHANEVTYDNNFILIELLLIHILYTMVMVLAPRSFCTSRCSFTLARFTTPDDQYTCTENTQHARLSACFD